MQYRGMYSGIQQNRHMTHDLTDCVFIAIQRAHCVHAHTNSHSCLLPHHPLVPYPPPTALADSCTRLPPQPAIDIFRGREVCSETSLPERNAKEPHRFLLLPLPSQYSTLQLQEGAGAAARIAAHPVRRGGTRGRADGGGGGGSERDKEKARARGGRESIHTLESQDSTCHGFRQNCWAYGVCYFLLVNPALVLIPHSLPLLHRRSSFFSFGGEGWRKDGREGRRERASERERGERGGEGGREGREREGGRERRRTEGGRDGARERGREGGKEDGRYGGTLTEGG